MVMILRSRKAVIKVSVEFHFSEHGTGVRPDIRHFSEYFPGASFQIHTEADMPVMEELNPAHERYGMRRRNYNQIESLLNSRADVAIALDSDMRFYSPYVKLLPEMARRFGLCMPRNPREMILVDTRKGVDSDGVVGQDLAGMAVNFSPIAFHTHDPRARRLLQEALRLMRANPIRGTLMIPRAEWSLNDPANPNGLAGVHAYRLPVQWCVCQENISCGNEIMLHIGHGRVGRSYGMPWNRNPPE